MGSGALFHLAAQELSLQRYALLVRPAETSPHAESKARVGQRIANTSHGAQTASQARSVTAFSSTASFEEASARTFPSAWMGCEESSSATLLEIIFGL